MGYTPCHRFRFICCFTSCSTARVILRRIVYRWRKPVHTAYCTLNHRASASSYQLSNMKDPARDSNRRPQWLEARTLTATPPSPPHLATEEDSYVDRYSVSSQDCLVKHEDSTLLLVCSM